MSVFRKNEAEVENDWAAEESDESVTEEAVLDEFSEEDEDDDDEGASGEVRANVGAKKKGNSAPLSKKEKAALKAKELAEMDDVFAEFGIDIPNVEVKRDDEETKEPVIASGTSDSSDKKRKKRKKKMTQKASAVIEATPAVPLTKEEIKARLAAKTAGAKPKGPKVSTAISVALKEGGDGKHQTKSEIKKAKALDWER